MKVILKEDVENLGRLGDVKDVAPGYARNFLIPRGLVIAATDKRIAQVEHERRLIESRVNKRRTEAQGIAKSMAAKPLVMTVKCGEDGRLFGSVTAKDIATALAAQGYPVDRRSMRMDGPIKHLGDEELVVDLGFGVTSTITVSVVAKGAEAASQEAVAEEEVVAPSAEEAAPAAQ
ncbi:MAG: 50S ribosomal protein L9 [Nitrospirota bacterium]|nr:50S ribosomal protein L9 [Nitrospirota bacterium]